MIREAGEYDALFTWMVFGTTYDEVFGQAKPSYEARQTLYGKITEETFANPGPQGSQSRATITMRGLMPVSASDQLVEVGRGYTWRISGLREDMVDNETIFEVYR